MIDKTNLALELSFIQTYIYVLTTIHSLEYLPWKIVVSSISNLALRKLRALNLKIPQTQTYDYILSTLFNHHLTPKVTNNPSSVVHCKNERLLHFHLFHSISKTSLANSVLVVLTLVAVQCKVVVANLPTEVESGKFVVSPLLRYSKPACLPACFLAWQHLCHIQT